MEKEKFEKIVKDLSKNKKADYLKSGTLCHLNGPNSVVPYGASGLRLKKVEIIPHSKISDLKYGNNVFANVAKNSKLQVAFLEGVTTIPSNLMFSNASEEQNIKISELVLPKSLKIVKTGAFYDLEIETIWYLGKEENFEQVDVQAQNDTLDNVSYAIIMK